jgi:hypothetical protein
LDQATGLALYQSGWQADRLGSLGGKKFSQALVSIGNSHDLVAGLKQRRGALDNLSIAFMDRGAYR